jgi:acyl carrier protein
MENIKYNIVTLKNGNSYFVLEEISDNLDTYNLILNVEDEKDIKIVMQEVINGKTVLSEVKDYLNLSYLKTRFKTKIEESREAL